jgi:hypothetical protein
MVGAQPSALHYRTAKHTTQRGWGNAWGRGRDPGRPRATGAFSPHFPTFLPQPTPTRYRPPHPHAPALTSRSDEGSAEGAFDDAAAPVRGLQPVRPYRKRAREADVGGPAEAGCRGLGSVCRRQFRQQSCLHSPRPRPPPPPLQDYLCGKITNNVKHGVVSPHQPSSDRRPHPIQPCNGNDCTAPHLGRGWG